MMLKKLLNNKKNLGYIILTIIVVMLCLWAFISSVILTKSFKNKIIDQTYNNKSANIQNLLVTETKENEKLWELFADTGRYSDVDNFVFLEGIVGNFYEKNNVKASFKSDKGTYNTSTKEIMLKDNVLLIYSDGTNISCDNIQYKGKNTDITANGNVRIEKPNEAVIYGSKAVLNGDYSNFHVEGKTKTKFYM